MSEQVKTYPLFHEGDEHSAEGTSIYAENGTIGHAISQTKGSIYMDVPGLGLVEVSEKAAMEAIVRLHEKNGSSLFALGKIGKDSGVPNYYHSRLLMHWS